MKWSEQELAYLKALNAIEDITEITKLYNQHAQQVGWVERSRNGIYDRIKRMRCPQKNCPLCGIAFQNTTEFCSRRCAASVSVTANGHQSWEPEAEIYLQELVGTDRIEGIVKKFNRMAAKLGWAKRSETSLIVKIQRLGMSRVPIADHLNCTNLAAILRIDRDRVHNWVAKGWLKASTNRPYRSPKVIKIDDFIKFADTYPSKLQGIHPTILSFLLPRETVYRILTTPFDLTGVKIQVQRTDTGEIFESLNEACKKAFVDRRTLAKSLRRNKPCCGIPFKIIKTNRIDYSYLANQFRPRHEEPQV